MENHVNPFSSRDCTKVSQNTLFTVVENEHFIKKTAQIVFCHLLFKKSKKVFNATLGLKMMYYIMVCTRILDCNRQPIFIYASNYK